MAVGVAGGGGGADVDVGVGAGFRVRVGVGGWCSVGYAFVDRIIIVCAPCVWIIYRHRVSPCYT